MGDRHDEAARELLRDLVTMKDEVRYFLPEEANRVFDDRLHAATLNIADALRTAAKKAETQEDPKP